MTRGVRFARASCAALLLIAGPAVFAEDTVTKDAMADRMLKDCMKHRDPAKSEDETLTACKRQVDREMKNARKEELSKGPASTEPGPPK